MDHVMTRFTPTAIANSIGLINIMIIVENITFSICLTNRAPLPLRERHIYTSLNCCWLVISAI